MKRLKRKILVVEDEESIRFLLRQNLEFEGYEVIEAEDGEAGLKGAETEAPDLVLLDLMLPKMSGMEVCKRLRETGNDVPIIMLTARGQQMDKVIGLKSGADDYITKPFDILELTARVEALFRRLGKPVHFDEKFRLRDLEIDFKAHQIHRPDNVLEMTKIESQLLRYLIHHEGKILPREQIMEDVWGHDYLLSSRTIDTHITHLRKKIEENPSDPKHIVTVH
ncbi:MAG: response regulator transcription factor, partial [Bacteroidota bacterium]